MNSTDTGLTEGLAVGQWDELTQQLAEVREVVERGLRERAAAYGVGAQLLSDATSHQ